MNTEITTLDLSFRRRSIIGYSFGMALYMLAVVALYPSFKNSASLDELTANSPGVAALFGISGSLTSPTGWISANAYANFFPLILLLLTIGYGAACLAGQEHDGHLELVLLAALHPASHGRREGRGPAVSRPSSSAWWSSPARLAGRAFQMTFDVGHLATTTLGVALLGIDLGLVALAIGGGTGNRGLAIAVAASIAAASFLVSSMAPLVSWLGPAKYASLFYWAVGDNQLDQGLSLGGLAVLAGVAVAMVAAAVVAFEHHDLS